MADGCLDGYYEDHQTGKCKKSIVVKRKGIYGEGFLSEPQHEQYAKIRKEENVEPPKLVDEQIAAENSFTYRNPNLHPAANKDLRYAESLNPDRKKDPPAVNSQSRTRTTGGDRMVGKCPDGKELVEGYDKDDGTHVDPYCRKIRNDITPEDHEIFVKDGEDAKGSRYKDKRH